MSRIYLDLLFHLMEVNGVYTIMLKSMYCRHSNAVFISGKPFTGTTLYMSRQFICTDFPSKIRKMTTTSGMFLRHLILVYLSSTQFSRYIY